MASPGGNDFLRALTRARAASRAETWRDAIPLWDVVLACNEHLPGL